MADQTCKYCVFGFQYFDDLQCHKHGKLTTPEATCDQYKQYHTVLVDGKDWTETCRVKLFTGSDGALLAAYRYWSKTRQTPKSVEIDEELFLVTRTGEGIFEVEMF